jgi:hypothetical protein
MRGEVGRILRVVLSGACLSLVAAQPARAAVPPLDGHVTDPRHKLKSVDEESMENKLGRIQSDTQVDVAIWLSDAPADAASDLGSEAYEQWHIGRDWENGILLVFPAVGPLHVILNPKRPALAVAEITKVVAADYNPSASWMDRIDRTANEIGSVLRVGAKEPKPRPAGHGDPRLAIRYAVPTGAIALLALFRSLGRRVKRRGTRLRHG